MTAVSSTFAIPRPRGPYAPDGPPDSPSGCSPGDPPVRANPGCAWDYLVMPVDAGFGLLRRGVRTGPVEYDPEAGRVRVAVPPGSAEELPGLLEWLEWGGIELELSALEGPRCGGCAELSDTADTAETTGSTGYRPRETTGWLRPPVPGREVDLVRLVSAAATECHRAWLWRNTGAGHANDVDDVPDIPDVADARDCQALAFSYASRMLAGTRPRSLTS